MIMTEERLIFCFKKVKEAIDAYKLLDQLGGTHTLKSVSQLKKAIESTLKGSLVIRQLNEKYVEGGPVLGFFLLSAAGDYTIVHLELNACWTRLVLTKELFHVLLDSEEARNIAIAGHLDEFMSSIPERKNVAEPAVVAEYLAEFAAMEFLFPFADRLVILGTDYTSEKVSKSYMIPKVMVERYLSKEYMGFFSPYFKDAKTGTE